MQLRISTKISLAFTFIVLLLIISGGNTFFSLNSAKVSLLEIREASQCLMLEVEAKDEFKNSIADIRGFMVYGKEEFRQQIEETLAQTLAKEKELLLKTEGENKASVERLITTTTQYRERVLRELIPLASLYHQQLGVGNLGKAQEYRKEMDEVAQNLVPLTKELVGTIDELVKKNNETFAAAQDQAVVGANRVIMVALGLSIIASIIGGLLSMLLTQNIVKPLLAAVNYNINLAQGDLTRDIDPLSLQRQDELGLLARASQEITDNFRQLLKKIVVSTQMVAASSEELTANSEQSAQTADQVAASITLVAQGAEKQSTIVENTSAIVEKMSAGIQQIAANAGQVANVADQATQEAQQGVAAVEKAIKQMISIEARVNNSANLVNKLGARSREIGQIMGTISAIADQTNLLALNAAIEAARAGEQGKGFAVVAEEVRKLAEQSLAASKQIADLIQETQDDTGRAVSAMEEGTEEVKEGTAVVNTAGEDFHQIAALIEQISQQIQEISAATQQMARGSQEIVATVQQINLTSREAVNQAENVSAATQEQAASMEEIAASSASLAQMAEELNTAVQRFKI